MESLDRLPPAPCAPIAPRSRANREPRGSPSAFSTQTSGQIPGSPAAILVMSRKPPAASCSSAASSSAAPAAWFISEAGDQVRHVADVGDEPIVVSSPAARASARPSARDDPVQAGVARSGGVAVPA